MNIKVTNTVVLIMLLAGCSSLQFGSNDRTQASGSFTGDDWDTEDTQPGFFTGKSGAITIKVEDGELKVGDSEEKE